jgi:putative SOS response-associated peptidase YedK
MAQGAINQRPYTFNTSTTHHSRMPVILREEDEHDWLNPQLPLADAQTLLAPYPADPLTMYEVSPKVNSPAFNEENLVRPV